MNPFEDLVPRRSSANPFGDLIPSAPNLAPSASPFPAPNPMLNDTFVPDVPFDPRAMPGVAPAPDIGPGRPVGNPLASLFANMGQGGVPEDQRALMDAFLPPPTPFSTPPGADRPVDESTALGDLRAGGYMARNVGRGLGMIPDVARIARAGGSRSVPGRIGAAEEFETLAAQMEDELAALPPDDPRQRTLPAEIERLRGLAGGARLQAEEPAVIAQQDRFDRSAREAAMSLIERLPGVLADQQAAADIPLNPQAERIMRAGESEQPWREGLSALGDDPLGVLRTFGLRAAPASAPAIAAAIVGQFLGGPVGASALGGSVGGLTEAGASTAESLVAGLLEAGVDPQNNEAVQQYFTENPEAMASILSRAAGRGAIMTGAEAVGGGLIGRLAQATANAGRAARVGTVAAGVPIQGAAEGGGEAVAGLTFEGEVDPGEVMAEFLGGSALGAPQAAGQIAAEGVNARREARDRQTLADLFRMMEEVRAQEAASREQTAPQEAVAPQEAPAQTPEAEVAPQAPPQPEPQAVQQASPFDDLIPAQPDTPPAQEAPVAPQPVTPEQAPAQQVAPEETSIGQAVDPRIAEQARAIERQAIADEPSLRLQQPLVSAIVRRGGIAPTRVDANGNTVPTWAAQELRSRGITPRTHPRLFRRDGITDLDNIDPVMIGPDAAVIFGTDDSGNYLNRESLLSAIEDELSGRGPRHTSLAAQQAYNDLQQAISDLERYGPQAAPDTPSGLVIERGDMTREAFTRIVDDAVADYVNDRGLDVTAEERDQIVAAYADRDSIDIEDAVMDQMMRSVMNGTWTPPERSDATTEIPGFDDVPAESGRDAARGADDGAGGRRSAEGRGATDTGEPRPSGATEQTAAGEQAVIPGAEARPAGEGTQRAAQTRAQDEARVRQQQSQMRTSTPQEAPGPLFGDDQQSLLDAPPTRVGRPGGRLAPTFMGFSYTNRQSAFDHAFRAAGVDPEKAVNMPVAEQIRIISKAIKDTFGVNVDLPKKTIRRKNRFGRMITEQRTDLSERKAVDQLLNAYRQMQAMAHIMGLPEKALGLPADGSTITLSLVAGRSLRGALGMYAYTGKGEARTIYLPDMSNSFAHEWAHALDHWMGMVGGMSNAVGLLTREQGKGRIPQSQAPRRVLSDAFAHVIWSMYGDQSKVGAWILQQQQDSAQISPDGNPTPKAVRAMRALTDMKEGRIPPQELLSGFFKTSREYEQATGNDGYFTDPAEMFARAFESWVGNQVADQIGGPSAFLSKGDWAYRESDDPRAKMTFPRNIDAVQFSDAMVAMRAALGAMPEMTGPAAKAPDASVRSSIPAMLLSAQDRSNKDSIARVERAEMRRLLNSVAAFPGWVTETLPNGLRFLATDVYRKFGQSAAATAYAIAYKHKDNARAFEALYGLAQKIGTEPGKGKPQQMVFQDRVESEYNNILNQIQSALLKAGRKRGVTKQLLSTRSHNLTDAELLALRKALSSERATLSPELQSLAQDLRAILVDLWWKQTNAGIKVGWQDNYLPHNYIRQAVEGPESAQRFVNKASEVYALMFDREVRQNPDPDSQVSDINTIIRGLRSAKARNPDGTTSPESRLTEADEALIARYRDAKRRLRQLERDQKKSDDPDKYEEKIAAQIEAVEEALGDTLDMLSDRWSLYSAENWQQALVVGAMNDFDGVSPPVSHIQARVLPAETPSIMQEFMPQDPIAIITSYAANATRYAIFHEMFGKPIEDGGTASATKIETMLKVAASEGVSSQEIDTMKMAIAAATARLSGGRSLAGTVLAYLNVNQSIKMLSFSAFASLVESATAGHRMGYKDKTFGLATSLKGLAAPFYNASNLSRAQLREIAEIAGYVAPAMMDNMMQSRLNMDMMQKHPLLMELTNRAFIINGLTPLTLHQRVMLTPLAHGFVDRMLKADAEGKAWAGRELNEVGITADVRADLKRWLDQFGGIPSAQSFYENNTMNKAAEVYTRALYQIIMSTIQQPTRADRPIAASYPILSTVYGIMSFMNRFTRSVIWRAYDRAIADVRDQRGPVRKSLAAIDGAMHFAAPGVVLVAAQGLAWMLRLLVQDPDRLKELMDDEDEPFLSEFLRQGFMRSGLVGNVDPFVQAATGMKYQTDLTRLAAGASMSNILSGFQEMAGALAGRNSANTNTAEHGFYRSAYSTLIQPFLQAGIAMSGPVGPISIWGTRAAFLGVSAPQTRNRFADMIVGERGSRHVGDPPWWQEFNRSGR
jgi:hypothetical protein